MYISSGRCDVKWKLAKLIGTLEVAMRYHHLGDLAGQAEGQIMMALLRDAASSHVHCMRCKAPARNCSIALCRQRKAVEDQISHFGQTPSQLFRRKHPKRGPPPPPSIHPLLNGPDAMKLSTVGMPPSRRCWRPSSWPPLHLTLVGLLNS